MKAVRAPASRSNGNLVPQHPGRLAAILFQLFLSVSLLLGSSCVDGRIGEKPRILHSPESTAVIAGQSVLFVCLVEGNPAPEVQWKVSGASIADARFGEPVRAPRGSVLRVTNVLPSYHGALVTCTATNALGQAEASASLKVTASEGLAPKGFPRFLNSFSVIVSKKNTEVELECRATGIPQPKISWFKDGVPVDLTNPRFRKSNEGNLKISDLVEEDEGKYECSATNSEGSRLSSGDNLLVRDNVEAILQLLAPSTKRFRPHFTSTPRKRQIVAPGGSLTLTCTAVGAPVPTVTWYRGGQPLIRESLGLQPPGTGTVQLADLLESSNITCVAESSMGKISHEIQVVVKTLPKSPGRFHALDIGSVHARLALEPSPASTTSPVHNYLALWLPSADLTNQSLQMLPTGFSSGWPTVKNIFHLPGGRKTDEPEFVVMPTEAVRATRIGDGRVKLVETPDGGAPPSPGTIDVVLVSLSNLKPFTEYSVWSKAVGADGDSSLSGPISTFLTREIAPTDAPGNVHCHAISNAAVTVYWDPPHKPNGKIKAYRIYYTDRPSLELAFWDTSIVSMETQAPGGLAEQHQGPGDLDRREGHLSILSHLTANATYHLRVSAVNSQGEGPASPEVTVIVRPGLLAPPHNLTAVAKSSHEVHLTWKKPVDVERSALRLEHYLLEVIPTTSTVTGFHTPQSNSPAPENKRLIAAHLEQLLVPGMAPDTQYLFRMMSVSQAGTGVPTQAVARTKKFVPAAPENLTVVALGPGELKVTWCQPRAQVGSQTGTQPAASEGGNPSRIAYYDLSWRPVQSSDGRLFQGTESSPSIGSSQLPWATSSASTSASNGLTRRLVPAVRGKENPVECYTSNISGLKSANQYVVQIRAVSPSGPGDLATSNSVTTWDHPPDAPEKLRVFSQLIPPIAVGSPPQVLLKVSWAPSAYDPNSPSPPRYRVSWRLVQDTQYFIASKRLARRQSSFPAGGSEQSQLYWQTGRFNPTRDWSKVEDLFPAVYLQEEANTTDNSWSPKTNRFLLGMTYEFRVAVITEVQIGLDAVEQVDLEGTAPTSAPTSVHVTSQPKPFTLSWAPPEWAHRNGFFTAYEVKCQLISLTADSSALQHDDELSRTANVVQVTLNNSRIDWLGQDFSKEAESGDLRVPVAWPSGRIGLASHLEQYPGRQLLASKVVCLVRGRNNFGAGPWSPPTTVYPKQSAPLPPPDSIRALVLPQNDQVIRVSWAMPDGLVQTLVTRDFVQSPVGTPKMLASLLYRRFVVYVSSQGEGNWTRYITRGPSTEIAVPMCSPSAKCLVRLSSIGAGDHEGAWSEAFAVRRQHQQGAISVPKLACQPVFVGPAGQWCLSLRWRRPSSGRETMNQPPRISHYRVNYTMMSANSPERELSLPVSHQLQASQSEWIHHDLPSLRADSVYMVSVRPVIRESSTTGGYFGLPTDVRCSIPNKVQHQVQSPWMIKKDAFVSDQYLHIGCQPVRSGLQPIRSNVVYELLASQLVEELPQQPTTLARWILMSKGRQEVAENAVFIVELSQSVVKNEEEVQLIEPRGRVIPGQRLEPGQSYALALRACVNENLSSLSTREPSRICYQSPWYFPVSTYGNQSIVTQTSRPYAFNDVDAVLWSSEVGQDSQTSSQSLPSDDAAAKTPTGGDLKATETFKEKSQSDQSRQTDSQNPGEGEKSQQDRDLAAAHQSSNPSTVDRISSVKTTRTASSLPLLITGVLFTVALLFIGLIASLLLLHRRRRKEESGVSSHRANGHHSSSGLRWSRSGYSLLRWMAPGSKNAPRHRNLAGSHSMSEVKGTPSPGGQTTVANLNSTLKSYPSNSLTSPCFGDFPDFPSSMDPTRSSLLGSGNHRHHQNECMDARSTSNGIAQPPVYFGSLRSELLRGNGLSHLPSTDSPTATLFASEGVNRPLNRINSLLMEQWNGGQQSLASPSPSSALTGNAIARPGHAEALSACNGHTVGSLKSMSPINAKWGHPMSLTGTSLTCSNGFAHAARSNPIHIDDLLEHVRTLKADNGRLMAAEFESIDPGGQYTWEHSNRPANRPKNRYANIVAYDHSRVVLETPAFSDPDTDYINANYLDGYHRKMVYIATQGPLAHTVSDFWRMIWDQQTAMIVSMTRLEERARVKCEQYWPSGIGTPSKAGRVPAASNGARAPEHFLEARPTSGVGEDSSVVYTNRGVSTSQVRLTTNGIADENGWLFPATRLAETVHGEITVGLLDVLELAYYTMRTFVLHKASSSETREVRQLQFTAWPDHGVPNHPAPLLMFLRRVRAETPSNAGPIVVHCSAGVGRTGAFILLDILLEQMRNEKTVDVFGTVNLLRSQRNFMVQTEDQYAFIYSALVEAAASGNTELPVDQLGAHWSRLTNDQEPLACQATTGLELEFCQLVAQTSRVGSTSSTAQSRIGLLSPVDLISTNDEDGYGGPSNLPLLPFVSVVCGGNSFRLKSALHKVNLSKNRSQEMTPHEANRVSLKAVRGVDGSDYINASYIDGYRCRAAYIATQTPLTNTLEDFWRMIWEAGSCIIVRLEGSSLGGRETRYLDTPVYWPSVQPTRHGYLVIDPVATYPMTSYVLRELRLTDARDGSSRTVRLFDATSATSAMVELEEAPASSTSPIPSDGPVSIDTLTSSRPLMLGGETLENSGDSQLGHQLRRQFNMSGVEFRQRYRVLCQNLLDLAVHVHKTKEQFGVDGPITVHCNLGDGRTGVFIATSIALDRMRFEGVVDTFQTVKLLRWQRHRLVGSLKEYALCYATALEYIEAYDQYLT